MWPRSSRPTLRSALSAQCAATSGQRRTAQSAIDALSPRTGECRWCGGVFTTRNSKRRYCADRCRKAALRSRRAKAYCAIKNAEACRRWRADNLDASRWSDRRRNRAASRVARPWITRTPDGQRAPVGGVRMDVPLTRDLAAWMYATCRRLGCSPPSLVRAALDYSTTGRVTIGRQQVWRDRRGGPPGRSLSVLMSVLQRGYLESAVGRPGHGGASRALRRLLWQLKAVIDPPTGA